MVLNDIRLFIATPMYGGMCHGEYVTSLLNLTLSCFANGISTSIETLYNESLITRGRNNLVHSFLKTEGTHLLFIDSDIKFDPAGVFLMLQKNLDVLGGVYPTKRIDWKSVRDAVKAGATVEQLPFFASSLNFNASENTPTQGKLIDPLEVKDVPTGMLLIKREVFEKLKPVVKTCTFRENEKYAGETCYCFFDTEVIEDEYLSEDWYFCRKWKEIGGKIYAAPWMNLTHYGTYAFTGTFMPDIEKGEKK